MKRFVRIVIPENERRIIWRDQPQWSTDMDKCTEPYLGDDDSQQLYASKAKLDEFPYNRQWEDYKRYNNNYELIHTSSNRKRRVENVAYHVPLSRSYFKMWEMIYDFKLLDSAEGSIQTAHLAEGPGGFIEATCRYRVMQKRIIVEARDARDATAAAVGSAATAAATDTGEASDADKFFGITLRSAQKEVPGWVKSDSFLRMHPNVQIHYGSDGTGNLYLVHNIDAFCGYVGEHSCKLVTADGGFDFSVNFDQQEMLAVRLLLCQIYTALRVTQSGGAFICKFFDTYHRVSLEMLWLIATMFDTFSIVKPHTSRSANSERYVVAQGYYGTKSTLYIDALSGLRKLILSWQSADNLDEGDVNVRTNKNLWSIFELNSIPPSFEQAIREYNRTHAQLQKYTIDMTLDLIDRNVSQFDRIIGTQIQRAIRWCFKYRVPINTRCVYLANMMENFGDILKHNSNLSQYYRSNVRINTCEKFLRDGTGKHRYQDPNTRQPRSEYQRGRRQQHRQRQHRQRHQRQRPQQPQQPQQQNKQHVYNTIAGAGHSSCQTARRQYVTAASSAL